MAALTPRSLWDSKFAVVYIMPISITNIGWKTYFIVSLPRLHLALPRVLSLFHDSSSLSTRVSYLFSGSSSQKPRARLSKSEHPFLLRSWRARLTPIASLVQDRPHLRQGAPLRLCPRGQGRCQARRGLWQARRGFGRAGLAGVTRRFSWGLLCKVSVTISTTLPPTLNDASLLSVFPAPARHLERAVASMQATLEHERDLIQLGLLRERWARRNFQRVCRVARVQDARSLSHSEWLDSQSQARSNEGEHDASRRAKGRRERMPSKDEQEERGGRKRQRRQKRRSRSR